MTKNNLKKDRNSFFLICIPIFVFLFSISFISAAQPTVVTQQSSEGYIIEDTPQDIFKQGQNFQYNFFVYNVSNGFLITNATLNCTFYMADSYGDVKIMQRAEYYTADGHWNIPISGGNFSNIGQYFYGVKCVSLTKGGAQTGTWTVTPAGNDSNVLGLYIILILVTFSIGFIGFFGKNEWVSVIGGFAMMILGLYISQNGIDIYRNYLTVAFSYFTIGLGALFALIPVIEMIKD